MLPRLNVARWAVRALWTERHNAAVLAERAAEVAEDYKALLAATPDGSPAALKALLLRRHEELTKRAEGHRKGAALALARKALEGQGDLITALVSQRGFR